MLKSLSIRNIALVEQCNIEFIKGLNVLSGETGAGKSVILDSINFVLGQKADRSMITYGKTECSVSCEFDISNCASAKSALEEIGVELDGDDIVIKRIFNAEKGGSIRINGESVTASMLRKVTSHLVDVHGQSDHFALLEESNQLALIDEIAGEKVVEIKNELSNIVQNIKKIRQDLSSIGGSEEERAKRLDYLDFAIKEIEESAYFDGEEEQLETKRKLLKNHEKISIATTSAVQLFDEENCIIDKLIETQRYISSIAQFGENYEKLSSNIDVLVDNANEISRQLNDLLDEEYDVREADEIEDRLEYLTKFKNKYGNTFEEVTKNCEAMREEADKIRHGSELAEKYNKQLLEAFKQYKNTCEKLSNARKDCSVKLAEKLKTKLTELAMKNANFSVDFTSTYSEDKPSNNGADSIEFMFSANKGEPLKPLGKVISGGELSRLMLAVKSVTADAHEAGTFIFDEIDTGISGEAALVVSHTFAEISKDRQIIAISHLPQIVAMSDVSLLIKKSEEKDVTRTTVNSLDDESKIKEIVRLVGGNANSEAAVTHAKEMFISAQNYKKSL